ncbi:MAG: hypothetical protein ACYDA9_13785 [Terriglobia bacterium]
MRKFMFCALTIFLLATIDTSISLAQEKSAKPGPITGTWTCLSHGGPDGDSSFTLGLQQEGEKVSGSVDSPQGGMDITSGTFKEDTLEINLDTSQGSYVITGKLKDGQLAGSITLDGKPHATWEGKKEAPPAK